MAVTTTKTNKPLNPRGNDQSPKGYNRAELYSGKALDFDGTNDNVEVADNASLDFTTAMSAFCYARVDSTSLTGDYIFAKYDYGTNNRSWLILQDNKNFKIVISKNGQSGASNTKEYYAEAFQSNSEYYFIGFTFESNVLKLYVNGQEVTATKTNDAEVNAIYSGSAKLSIGSSQLSGSGANFFNGKVANARAFNVALTAAQVADLYNNPEKIVPTGVADSALKLWLPMQEGAGTTAYDGSGNGNHGTISGATWQHGIGAPVSQTAVIDWNKGHNYIDKSEEFETAYWTENRLVTITDDSFIAPDGSATATEIVESTANDTHFLAQTLSVTAGDYFISIFAKKRDYDFFQLSTGGDVSRYSNYNLTTGTLGNSSGFTNRFIEDYGNGWFRVGGKITTSATSFNYFPTLIQSDVASRFDTYTGTNKGVYIWGAQATKSATLLPYLRNIGTSAITSDVLLPQGLTTGRDITGVNLFENVRKQGALNLDGNSWAEVHDNASLDFGTGSFSLEAWAKLKYVAHGSSVNVIMTLGNEVNSSNSAGLAAATGNTVQFWYSNSSSSSALTEGDWVHIVGVYDETNATLYVNGSQVDQDARTAVSKTNASLKQIGRDTSGGRYYNDQIAQPRIYNRALTAEEVQRNYNAGKNIYK